MNIVLVSVLVVSAMCLVSSHKHHKGGPPHNMMMKFESCKPFYENMKKAFRELKEAKEIGPDVCLGEYKDCKKEDAIKVRCATENPSEECIKEVTDFMNGSNMCSAEV